MIFRSRTSVSFGGCTVEITAGGNNRRFYWQLQGRGVAVAPPAGRRDALFCPRQSACVHNTSPVSLAHCNLIKGGGGRWSEKVLNFEWPYFCQYSSELYQICSSCVLCGYRINFKISAHLHNLYHYYSEFHADQPCFHGKASFEKITWDTVFKFSAIVLYTLSGAITILDFF